jgi:hypothetical protein
MYIYKKENSFSTLTIGDKLKGAGCIILSFVFAHLIVAIFVSIPV